MAVAAFPAGLNMFSNHIDATMVFSGFYSPFTDNPQAGGSLSMRSGPSHASGVRGLMASAKVGLSKSVSTYSWKMDVPIETHLLMKSI